MFNALHAIQTEHTPETLTECLQGEAGVILLRSGLHDAVHARYSMVVARPFLTFTSYGTRCKVRRANESSVHFGNPWHLLDSLLSRYELLGEVDVPFPLGGCFGYWGYELKNALEPCLTRRALNDLEFPDSHLGFYDSLVVFDHLLHSTLVVSTGLCEDGSRSQQRARAQMEWWFSKLQGLGMDHATAQQNQAKRGAPEWHVTNPELTATKPRSPNELSADLPSDGCNPPSPDRSGAHATLDRNQFISKVQRAQAYIRSGDIYQVNLARRVSVRSDLDAWRYFQRLKQVSPAPFAAFMDCGSCQLASSSPELFLRLSGRHVRTRPIKGTRPRGSDPEQDTRLAYELQTSPKEQAELVMITDLLRNDLGRVCEYGTVCVPDLFRLERFSHVQHLVSTVEGQLRPEVTHLGALASSFPGGSITGAPKIRAMQIIDELEPVTRGPYTGALGYLGFNRESQLSIIIRTAAWTHGQVHFHVGSGIVADSDPSMEYEETVAKAQGILAALNGIAGVPADCDSLMSTKQPGGTPSTLNTRTP